MSRGDERSAGRQRGDTYYKERRGHGHGKDDEDNERWRVRNRWAKTYPFHVRIEYFTLGDHAASNRGPDLRHGCIRAPRGLAFLASIEGYRCVRETSLLGGPRLTRERALFRFVKNPALPLYRSGSLCSLLRYNTASYINFYTALINAGARDRADHSRAMSETGRKMEGGHIFAGAGTEGRREIAWRPDICGTQTVK